MKKSTVALLAVALLLLAMGIVASSNIAKLEIREPQPALPEKKPAEPKREPAEPAPEALALPRPPPPEPATAGALSAEEKKARIEKIKRDYDEIRTKASADYAAAGAAFPGGLSAFLRQLALLEREKRADLATILSPRELEDLELRETPAGELVQRQLGKTAATDEQRRAVFQLQRAFEAQFALSFDTTPQALFERERARQQTQETIYAVLGSELFGAWIATDGVDYTNFVAIAARQNLPPTAVIELWRAKNEFTLRRLDLAANGGLSREQLVTAQKTLVQDIETRLTEVLGPAGLQAARNDGLRWLPKK